MHLDRADGHHYAPDSHYLSSRQRTVSGSRQKGAKPAKFLKGLEALLLGGLHVLSMKIHRRCPIVISLARIEPELNDGLFDLRFDLISPFSPSKYLSKITRVACVALRFVEGPAHVCQNLQPDELKT